MRNDDRTVEKVAARSGISGNRGSARRRAGASGSEASGIAYAAHIGGFFAGLLLVKKFLPAERVTFFKKR